METLFLIDASGYLYRSYHAIRGMTNARGESTNALFGFIRSLQKLIKDFSPEHLVAVFDGPRSLEKRSALYSAYKAHRKEMPGDLRYQIQWAKEYCHLMGLPQLTVEGVEADDTLGSVACWAEQEGCRVYLCTSDKDMAQLVTDRISILNTFKENQILGPREVEQIYGVPPKLMVDWLAITGDASDNVPGLPGFGPKTATALLQQFGSLEALLAQPEKLAGKKRETVQQEAQKVLLSRQLVTIDTQVPFPRDREFFKIVGPDVPRLREFYAQMNFNSLLRELSDVVQHQADAADAAHDVQYHLIDEEAALEQLVRSLSQAAKICVDTETTGVRPLCATLVGIGLGVRPGEAWYIPTNGVLGLSKVCEALNPLFANPNIEFYGHNLKYDLQVLNSVGLRMPHICFDTLLAAYILNSHQRRYALDDLALEIFGKKMIAIEELIGKGRHQVTMAEVPIPKVQAYCGEDVDYTCRLHEVLSKALEERGLQRVYYDIELPLLPVLARMERQGIFLDAPRLKAMGEQINAQIMQAAEEIYAMVGERFNLNSPKQLSEILFTKMGIKPPRKTATGHSTSADVLESLAEDYPLARKMLEYRSLEKLRSTYIDALPSEINSNTGRIHPNFNQSVAATGRLACQDPNLQNIPVKTVVGRKIRAAFRPQQEGWSFLAADYSQIELRLLAHFSEDPQLLEAFHREQDVHAHTASIVFGIALTDVSYEHRQQAKAVNFGVIYGQQAFGLGRELGIDVKSASQFIDLYFKRYPNVRGYVNTCIEQARISGRAVTMTGRERLIPEITSQNSHLRSAAERLAINTPLQGSAADLIKMAMITLDRLLIERGLRAKMILQIHDELLFEVPDEEIPTVTDLVKEVMEGVVSLRVPLVVDIKVGKNWEEC
jgi:DNA polymerase-1